MKLLAPPPFDSKHVEEHNKLVASGLQNLALLLFGAVLLQPLLNPALTPPSWLRAAAFVVSGLAELAAILTLRYIPYPGTKGGSA